MDICKHSDKELMQEIKRRGIKIEIINWFPFMPYAPSQVQIGDEIFDID